MIILNTLLWLLTRGFVVWIHLAAYVKTMGGSK